MGSVLYSSSLPSSSPVALRVWLLDPDVYLDRGSQLAVLTTECLEAADVDTDVLLRRQADSDAPELAFPSGQACAVSFVGVPQVSIPRHRTEVEVGTTRTTGPETCETP